MPDTFPRRDFLRWGLASGLCAAGTKGFGAGPRAFPLEEATVERLRGALDAGDLSAVSLAAAYLRRVRDLDRAGPRLHSVIETNPEALRLAAALDAERRPRGPLHGIPVLVKDNLDTADRMSTTAGSWALAEAPPPREDAFVVGKLRRAGALLLGKTNLSEWANFRSTRSTSGWSGRGGLTLNPYALDRNPSGSSSGSAVAVAANLCPLAVGTETDGSITSPAAACGIVGLKPTVGLLSRSGIIPISATQDTAGPMARTVRDAALLLGVLAGEDPRDPATLGAAPRISQDYTRFLDPQGLRGARLGVVRNLFGSQPEVNVLAQACLDRIRGAGAELVDVELSTSAYEGAEMDVLLFEFKAGLDAYLARRGGAVAGLADLIAFNEREKGREMAHFGQEILLQAQAKGPLTDDAYLRALETCRRLSRAEGIDRVLETHRLDALVCPTGGPPWLTDYLNGDHYGASCTTPAAVAGYPHLTVPAGFVHGLPIGFSFFGRAWSEGTLLRFGYDFEGLVRARRPPRFLRSVPLDS